MKTENWISVAEQLPDLHEWVLVADEYGATGYAHYHSEYPEICAFEFIEYTDLIDARRITHWLRIPSSPNA